MADEKGIPSRIQEPNGFKFLEIMEAVSAAMESLTQRCAAQSQIIESLQIEISRIKTEVSVLSRKLSTLKAQTEAKL